MTRYSEYPKRKSDYKEQQDDYGIVFYRDKRKLISPPGYDENESKLDSKVLFPNNTGVTLHEGSLLKMCFKYISQNINILDSLIGLPEIIGKELFLFMIDNNVLKLNSIPFSKDNNNEANKLKCLRIFNEAFGQELLKSLSLHTMPKEIPYVSKLLVCFEGLVELDLSGNVLNDNALSEFYNLYNLQVLFVNDCELTNFSIKKMTLPYRLYNQYSPKLKILDLKGNLQVTWESIPLLFVFTSLNILNISDTNVKEKDLPKQKLSDQKFITQVTVNEYHRPKTEGWAKPIIEELYKHSEESTNSRKRLKTNFYSTTKEIKEKITKKENLSKNVLYLVRSFDEECCEPTSVPKKSNFETPKRKQNFFGHSESDEEYDFLNQYGR